MTDVVRRPTEDDHAAVVGVIPAWWGLPGDTTLPLLLPRLFFQHFTDTSLLVTDEEGLAGFLIGFHSASRPGTAYIHFVGVRPDRRQSGLARALYARFFDEARAAGCTAAEAITGPLNTRSQAFHVAMGFTVAPGAHIDGVPAQRDYDGPGAHRVAFHRDL